LLNCETWGRELFPYRAEKATARMDRCHSAAWERYSLTGASITTLGCNPPYDDTSFNSGTLVSNHQLHQRFNGCLIGYHHPILPGKGYRVRRKAGL
jgi:hypothetical protein